MQTCNVESMFKTIMDLLSLPDTQVYTKDSKLYLKIPSKDTPINGEFTVNELFQSLSAN